VDRYYNGHSPYMLGKGSVAPSEKYKIIQRRLLAVLLFLILLWSFLSFIRSDFFTLQEIEVRGNIHTAQDEILQAIGAVKGENIWRVSPSLLRGSVLGIPRVDTVEIHRLPPSSLLVEVVEKEAMALVPFGEYLLEISFEGQIIGSTQTPQYYGLPLLTGVPPQDLNIGSYIIHGKHLSDLNHAVRALEKYGLTVSELNFADPANLLVITMDGLVAWLGDSEFVEKVDLLSQISAQMPSQIESGYLDLRVKEAPVFSPLANSGK